MRWLVEPTVGIEPTTCGLRIGGQPCCSRLSGTYLEQAVHPIHSYGDTSCYPVLAIWLAKWLAKTGFICHLWCESEFLRLLEIPFSFL